MNYAKQYPETIDYARKALDIDPNFYPIWWVMGLAQLHQGSTLEAITSLKRVMELAPWHYALAWYLAAAYNQAGDNEHCREWKGKLVAHDHTYEVAVYHAAAGEADAMFEALNGAYQRRDPYLPHCLIEPFFDPYRADPRFQALLRRMNMA